MCVCVCVSMSSFLVRASNLLRVAQLLNMIGTCARGIGKHAGAHVWCGNALNFAWKLFPNWYPVYNLSFIISIDLWLFEIASWQTRFRDRCTLDFNVIPLKEVREFLSVEMRLELRVSKRVTQLLADLTNPYVNSGISASHQLVGILFR